MTILLANGTMQLASHLCGSVGGRLGSIDTERNSPMAAKMAICWLSWLKSTYADRSKGNVEGDLFNVWFVCVSSGTSLPVSLLKTSVI